MTPTTENSPLVDRVEVDPACNYSPAREPSAITVGATTSSDARSSYSKFGNCLDLFAPGSSIKSTWSTSTTATNTISGTSMASPHVAGWAAQILQSTPSATPIQVADAIKAAATTGKVTSAGTGSPNLLMFVGASTDTDTPPPDTTVVSVSTLTGESRALALPASSCGARCASALARRDLLNLGIRRRGARLLR